MDTDVLVVGGGLVGSSAALFLAWRGVSTVLVEKHPGSSKHPRAVGYTPRTVELLRAVGLESELPPAPVGVSVRRVRTKSLTSEWGEELPWSPPTEPPEIEYSPCGGTGLAQDRMEPLLRNRARELGADIRLGTEVLSFDQDDDGVTAVTTGGTIHARYLVAADGHRSPIREQLGIGRSGRGLLSTARSVLFRAPLQEYLERGVGQFVTDVGFLTTYGDGRWVLFFDDNPELDELDLVRRAIGRDDVPIEVITTGRWEITALIADEYRRGRIFLAGDAAHTLPPSRGGYGANVGIEDVHNLAWKLQAVLSGEARVELLDTYEPERRPVAQLCHQQIFARADGQDPTGEREEVPIIDDFAMAFGVLYRPFGPDLPPARRPDEWAGQPGTRAPHVRLGKKSTLDLFQRDWVLLANAGEWAQAAVEHGVEHHAIGDMRAFGVSDDGASLIRPDGYIAWRSTGLVADPGKALREALDRYAYR